MSQIFDALMRSEMDRSGSGPTTPTETTDLLRHVESHANVEWTSTAALTQEHEPEMRVGSGPFVHAQARRRQFTNEAEKPPSFGGRSSVFECFPSLKVSIPAESHLVCLTSEEGPAAEAFRLLGVRLRDIRRERPLQKLVITSTVPQEGKSTVAANLACSLARRTEERVLLLEGDVRRPSLTATLKLGGRAGLCDCLRDVQKVSESILHLSDQGFWVLPAGRAPSNPLDLLQSKQLQLVMDQLENWFDWIVIDAPPVLPLADTSVWTRLADGVLLVVRESVTRKRLLRRGLEAIDQHKLIGALMNGANFSGYSDYYYSQAVSSAAE